MSNQTITRKCSKCQIVKPLNEFYKDKYRKLGHRYECKACCGERLAQYRTTERGKIICKQVMQKYGKTTKGKANKKRCSKAYRVRYPLRIKATALVNRKVNNGTIPRADTLDCIYCSNGAKEYHHDKGYSRENLLNVVPICVRCHNNIRSC